MPKEIDIKNVLKDERDLKLYPNIFEFYSKEVLLGEGYSLWPTQLKIALEFLGEYCPKCTNMEFFNNMYNEKIDTILDNIQLLEYGICPKCKKNKFYFMKKGLLGYYTTMAGCAGQRSGKSVLNAVLAIYQLHRYLKLVDPPRFLSLLPGATQLLPGSNLSMIFTGVTLNQTKDCEWSNFRDMYAQCRWFTEYNTMLKYHGMKLGSSLYDINSENIYYKLKNMYCTVKAATRALRGRTVFFASIGEYAWMPWNKVKIASGSLENGTKAIRYNWKQLNTSIIKKHFYEYPYHIPTALTVYSSSPKDAADPLWDLFLNKPSEETYLYHYPTWKMNSMFTEKKIKEIKEGCERYFDRDFGAIPPWRGIVSDKLEILKVRKLELYYYIKHKKYYCCACNRLQEQVIKEGVDVIREYPGMICGAIEDMRMKLSEIESGE